MSYIGKISVGCLYFQVVPSNFIRMMVHFSRKLLMMFYVQALKIIARPEEFFPLMAALSVPTPSCKRPQRPRPTTERAGETFESGTNGWSSSKNTALEDDGSSHFLGSSFMYVPIIISLLVPNHQSIWTNS